MKILIGLVLVVLGIVLGLYVGGYLMFICGIIQLISSISPLNPGGIGWGIGRIVMGV